MSERYDYSDVCCAEGPPVTERNPATAPSGMASRSILRATHTPDARAVYGIALMILLGALALASMILSTGCSTISSTAVAELETAAAQSQANVNDPSVATSDRAKHALWAQGRVYQDVLLDVKGTPIPAFYSVNPWAPVVAPVTTK